MNEEVKTTPTNEEIARMIVEQFLKGKSVGEANNILAQAMGIVNNQTIS